MQHSTIFSLRDSRLTPRKAQRTLLDALSQFQVTNLGDVYVYRDRVGRVFYLHLHVTTNDEEDNAILSASSSSGSSSSGGDDGHVLSSSPPPYNVVVLRVYGVYPTDREITSELVNLIDNKLNEASLTILTTL